MVRAVACDVTDEAQVKAAFDYAAREFGGLDVLVANAGIASSAPIEQTTVELWDRNFDVLAQGYFLTAKHAWPLLKRMKEQGGSSVVFIGSKNAVAAGGGGLGLCLGQGGGQPSRPLPGAGRRAGGDPRERGQPRCGDQGQQDLGMATGARSGPPTTRSMPARSWKRITATARC